MRRPKSRHAGRDKATRRHVYQAIVPLVCVECSTPIGAGELFTRRALGVGGTGPVCWRHGAIVLS